MSSIQHLDLGENTFRGPIPKTLGGLTGLRYLNLELNNLSGAIPPEIWNVSSLMRLSFVKNALSGWDNTTKCTEQSSFSPDSVIEPKQVSWKYPNFIG
jgi:hypothetical protein